MDSTTLLLIVLLIAVLVAIGLLLAVLLRKSDNRMEQALRDERDSLTSQLQAERDNARVNSAEAARLGERVIGLERGEAELVDLKNMLHEERHAAGEVRAQLAARTSLLQQSESRNDKSNADLALLRQELDGLRRAHADAAANLSHSERANAGMRDFLANAQERLSGVFAELAGKTFDERTQKAALQSKSDIEMLLKPFSEQLSGFRTRVDMLYGEEAKERAALTGKIDELKTLNQDMASRANELTRALKGNAKIRGDWGELMLENVLQGSGLVEGSHYQRQKSATTEDGKRFLPDIVVNLPHERRIVVDSKVNLIAWQEAMNAGTPEEQQDALRRHSVALRQHVKELSDKHYPKLIGDGALEVTVAFVPIEGALSAALGADAALQTYAFEQKIVFASPNTLMALLRVVERLWTRDKIQREAQEIAKTGGLVLDSLVNFLADFDNVGRQLEDATSAFNDARHKLSNSKQALIPRAQRLVDLGAKGKKTLPEELQGSVDALRDGEPARAPALGLEQGDA
ncbi:DNA recombination protein RmuC [Thermomonas sp. HDW16]|uniref:DNA recombination protein RmuC n=1 Tax=Thermomonas sp. HDW16 TaxID=2714945 RepID=UPI00140DF2A3|nr:DNA recombination protein RmuC [Thermomonas sp. HDW16]QIL19436.1 DNA recombination protein RmuC [Thermomonas sp. HDW16]